MDQSTARQKLEEASEHYNRGRYPEAIRLWEEVLRLDPGNQKARDGIQMASLLVDQFSGASAPRADGSDLDDTAPVMREARVHAGISRVRELLSGGSVDEAAEGCALLEELAPDLAEVRQLAQEVRAAAQEMAQAQGASDLESLLAEARRALAEGRNEDAAAAAMRAAEIEPGNTEACGIISLVGDSQAVGADEPPGPSGLPPIPDLDLDGALTQAIPAAAARTPIPALAIPEPEISRPDIPELTLPAGVASSGAQRDRIAALIREGQAAFESERFEAAIEAWSRVFAIDQTNGQAGALIDRAKEAIDARARELEEMLYSASDARSAGRMAEAMEICNRMLERNPNHVEALSLLDEISSDQASAAAGEITIGIDHRAVEEAAAEKVKHAADQAIFNESVPLAVSPGRIAPASRSSRREERPFPSPGPAPRAGRGRMVALSVVVIGLAAGAGWYFWSGGSVASGPHVQMAPSPAQPSPQPPGPPAVSTEQPPQQNASLQVLPVTPTQEAPPDPVPDGETPDTRSMARSREKDGRRHFADGEWTAAVLALREARQLDPVHFNSEPMLEDAMERLEAEARLERQVRSAIQAFNDRDYAAALHGFYRLQEGDASGKPYERHIRNSWFNWGVLLLKEGSLDEARQKFVEVRDMAPNDQEAGRAIDTIDRYEKRIVDEAFDSFVASLKLRTIE